MRIVLREEKGGDARTKVLFAIRDRREKERGLYANHST